MLALSGLLIVIIFMTLIMSKKATPFTALVMSPIVIAGAIHFGGKWGIGPFAAGEGWDLAKFSLDGIKGVAPTAVMLLFAILFFGLMISAGLFDPLARFILRVVRGDPLKVLVGTAILACIVSVDGDGSTTTMIVCSAMIPVYKKLNMKMMDLAVLIIMGNSIMNLLPWGGPTARIITALKVDEGELLRRIIPGMLIAVLWVMVVAFLRGRAERRRLGVVELSPEEIDALSAGDALGGAEGDNVSLKRPRRVLVNLALTLCVMVVLIFGGMAGIPKIGSAVIFEVAFALALLINYSKLADQRQIIEEHGANAMHVITMVLAAGIFMGILNGTKMSEQMGVWLADVVPASLGGHWALVTALASIPGTFLLSNDAFYLGVLPVMAQTGAQYGFTDMQIAVASTAGQAFHLLSPLVGFIYLLLHLTRVDMGAWQRRSALWSIGTYVIFLVSIAAFGGVSL